ncbi:MAG: hypothetical protein Q8O41_09440 [Candidatus Methanoperedens sp.]|nr:hypothetical protein [Candidatus Methanoperedens sp.]
MYPLTLHAKLPEQPIPAAKPLPHVAMLGAGRRDHTPENSYIRFKKCAPKKII